MSDIWFPGDSGKFVRALRFLNVLDDERNILSPTKINLWAANLAGFSAGAVTILQWLSGHISGITEMWGPIGGWMVQAHAAHHYNKKERNLQVIRKEEVVR